MWQTLYTVLEYAGLAALLLVNALGVGLVVMQLPGTWLILVSTALVAWWQWPTIGWWTLLLLLGLAVAGEVVEAFTAAAGARTVGGSKRGMLLGLALAISGALVGTLVTPVIGTVIGACVGAGLGSLLGDKWAGRSWRQARNAAGAAAAGRFVGTLGKAAVALAMWIVVTVAVCWP